VLLSLVPFNARSQPIVALAPRPLVQAQGYSKGREGREDIAAPAADAPVVPQGPASPRVSPREEAGVATVRNTPQLIT
jgi:hypothetical protein